MQQLTKPLDSFLSNIWQVAIDANHTKLKKILGRLKKLMYLAQTCSPTVCIVSQLNLGWSQVTSKDIYHIWRK